RESALALERCRTIAFVVLSGCRLRLRCRSDESSDPHFHPHLPVRHWDGCIMRFAPFRRVGCCYLQVDVVPRGTIVCVDAVTLLRALDSRGRQCRRWFPFHRFFFVAPFFMLRSRAPGACRCYVAVRTFPR